MFDDKAQPNPDLRPAVMHALQHSEVRRIQQGLESGTRFVRSIQLPLTLFPDAYQAEDIATSVKDLLQKALWHIAQRRNAAASGAYVPGIDVVAQINRESCVESLDGQFPLEISGLRKLNTLLEAVIAEGVQPASSTAQRKTAR